MSKTPGVIPSAAAEVPYHSAKRTRLKYSTVAKTVFCTFVMSNVPGVIPSAAAGNANNERNARNFSEAHNDLTEKVKFFYIEIEQQGAQQAQDMEVQNIECNNPHERFRAPMVDVESYPRFI
ncbi:hypothetical protein BB561_004260 [Smittium simulii]|uniref:Uncharacterized protein n=1 Tax=Smittium simulii TaxID=133385 RepID=A0A2T9YH91_9FUNG|nr:hypothetical protein BB561_004260 [Smittium simulii]